MSTYALHDSNITTKDDLKDWILRQLGYPLISVEMTDDQIDDNIDQSIQIYTEYAVDERQFYALPFSTYIENEGVDLPKNIVSVINLQSNVIGPSSYGAGRIDNYMNDLLTNGAISFPLFGRGGGGGWLGYELSMQYLELSQKMLGGDYDYKYNYRTRRLVVYPDPITSGNGTDGWAILTVYCVNPDEVQYGENWIKQMALAFCKITLGTIRSKFTDMILPGGGRIDASIGEKGEKEKDFLTIQLLEKNPVLSIIVQ
jgi:hypothetical protein